MKKVNVGIIGLGRFAEQHSRILRRLPYVEVTAICDRNPERFPKFKEWFPGAKCYEDWSVMLEAQAFDAVDVLTPEHLHAEPVRLALRSGANVFVEKPLAHTPEAAEMMMKEARDSGRILMTGHVLRFDPRYAAVKERIAQGYLGPLRSIYAKRNNGKQYFHLYDRVSPVFILGIHDIDLMHWYMEDEVAEVYAVRSFPPSSEAADMVWATLKFRRGGIGVIECNWLLPDGAASFMDVRMEIAGEDGSIVAQDPEQGVTYITNVRPETPAFLAGHETPGRFGGALYDELVHFFECVISRKPSDILRMEDACRAVQVAYAIEQSSKQGKPITLSAAGIGGERG